MIKALLLVLTFLIPQLLGQNFTGECVGDADGDTITVLSPVTNQVKIRLEGIDCPEGGQDFGNRAKQFTSALVFGKQVEVRPTGQDRYGRTLARVFVDGKDLSLELVKFGMAWHFKRYSDEQLLADAETLARKQGVGLWARPIPPWEYRRNQTPAVATTAGGKFHGNVKSNVYHGAGCQHYNCKNCTEPFASRQEAEAAGYRKHAQCVP